MPTPTQQKPLRAFHSDPEVKNKLVARIAAHEKADAIVQGTYGTKVNEHYERCAVGCSVHDLTEKQRESGNLHALYPELLGLPEWLAHLEDRIFEGLPQDKAAQWPRRFSEAISVGAEFDGLADRLAIRRLKEECLPLSGQWPDSVRAEVVAAIEQTIAALEGKKSLTAAAWSARAAAWSARAAARSAEWSASAAWSAASAASAAWSATAAESAAWWAAWSARAAARSAACEREADRIIAELEKLPVVG